MDPGVFARWGEYDSNASNAKYAITHAGGTDTVTKDQSALFGYWFKLGTYDLAPGAGHKVTISDRADSVVNADAIRIVSAEGVERIARWQGTVTTAGAYQVWARWPAAPTHAFAAGYDIMTPTGTQTVTVNQRIEGGQWHLLKTITLAANDNWTVELSDQSPGEVVADAVALTAPLTLADRFDWSPTLPSAAEYAVYAKWQAATDRATDATYEVTHSGGVSTVKVDQTHNGGEWHYLGTWSFNPGQSPKVSLLASLNGTVNADAVRFIAGDAIGGDIAYSHGDRLGTIQKLTDTSGTLVWDRTARPFGETVSISAASGVAQMLRFPGQYADETGLSYNYFRDYDPTLGRYLESDPIGLAGGINMYGYVSGNPIGKIDPSGENAAALPVAICAANPAACVIAGVVATGAAVGIWVYNEMNDGEISGPQCPPLPDRLLGEQDEDARQQGKRHNSGPIPPENGGTGDAKEDFDRLTGGTGRPVGDGILEGDNGIRYRPGVGDKGPRIDIPANGAKPHETIHY